MSTNDIIQFISTLGFPIVMCGALFWYMMKEQERHADESKLMQTAINELKIAIVELTASLKGGKDA